MLTSDADSWPELDCLHSKHAVKASMTTATQEVRQNLVVRDAFGLRKRRSDLSGCFDDVWEIKNTVKSIVINNLVHRSRASE
jgi:hypothetical protein